MTWPMAKLGDVADFVNGYAFKPAHWGNEGKKIIRIQNLTDRTKPFNQTTLDIDSKYVVEKGDILVSWSATLDVFTWENEDALLNQHIFKVIPNLDLIDTDYFKYALKGALESLSKFTKGSTMKHVNRGDFLNAKFSLPPLEIQKKIAVLLETADQLRKNSHTVVQNFNDLANSIFIEMFGDPVINPKKWKQTTLDSVCSDIYRYPTFYGFDYVESGAPVVKIGNITEDGYVNGDLSKYDFMPHDICKKYPRTILEVNDIVMAVRGDGSTGKRIGLVESENIVGGNISPNLIMFRADSTQVHPLFLYYFLISQGGQTKIEKYISKTAKKTITGKDIKKIEIYCPPVPEQEKFYKIYQNIRNLILNESRKTSELEDLFQSLLKKAFHGELKMKQIAA